LRDVDPANEVPPWGLLPSGKPTTGRPRGRPSATIPAGVARGSGSMSDRRFRAALADYLRIRRALGYKLAKDERTLLNFAEFLEACGAERVTIELALDWVTLRKRRDKTGMEQEMRVALHRRPSRSRCPRVMRWRSVRAQRSVDGGRVGGAIEPRNPNGSGCRRCVTGGRQHCRRRYGRVAGGPRAVGEPRHARQAPCARTGRSRGRPCPSMMPRPGWFAGWRIVGHGPRGER
jgi:hypothetical protein